MVRDDWSNVKFGMVEIRIGRVVGDIRGKWSIV